MRLPRLLYYFSALFFLALGVRAGIGYTERGSLGEHQTLADPQLTGPDRLCNVFGSVLGSYSGGGDPSTDVYAWKIFNPSNTQVFSRKSGDETITYTFSGSGTYRIELVVERGGLSIYSKNLDVEVVLGPKVTLQPDYSYCEDESVTMQAIDPTSANFSDYLFEWKNSGGVLVGSANELTVDYADDFSVSLYFMDAAGTPVCESQIYTKTVQSSDYTISASQTVVCPELPTLLSTSPPLDGTWKYLKAGQSSPELIGHGPTYKLVPNQNLEGEGNYAIIFEPEAASGMSCLAPKSIQITYLPQPDFTVIPSQSATDCDSFDGALTIEALTDLDYISVVGAGITTPSLVAGETLTIPGLKSGTYTLVGALGGCTNPVGTIVPLADPPSELMFTVEDIQGEICTANGKEQGSFVLRFQNPPATGNYRLIDRKGNLVAEKAFSNTHEIPFKINGGIYFLEVFNDGNCQLPEASEVEVPGLDQTQYSVPAELTICQTFDFIPQTSQALEFTLLYPDGTEETLPAGSPFKLTQAGAHTLLGVLPGQNLICPTEKQFSVILVDPVDFEAKLINQDCLGNMTYEADIAGRDPSTVVFKWYDESGAVVGTGQFFNPYSYGNFQLDVQPANSAACPFPPFDFEIKKPILEVEVTMESTKLCEYGPRAILAMSSTFPEEITDIEWRRFDELGNIEALPQYKDKQEITVDIAGTYEVAVFSRIPAINKDCELGRQTLEIDLIPDKVSFDAPAALSICDPHPLVPVSASPLEFEMTFPDGKVEIKAWNEAFMLDQEGTYVLLGYDPNIKGPLCPEEKKIEVKIFDPVQFSPELITMSCQGEYHYHAVVKNYLPEEVMYFWRDEAGNLVATTQDFFSTTYGNFSLEVQPAASLPCAIQPISFTLETPVLSVPVNIAAETLCPDQPDAALKLEADLEEVARIEWWFTDLSYNKSLLENENGKTEILAKNEGTYEGLIFNQFNCLLGSDDVFVARSTDQNRPELEASYQVCPKYQIAPTLNPGSFALYEWYFENDLVSTDPTFKPLLIGTYYVLVTSDEGCTYETSFETTEECDLEVVIPTGVQPSNSDKHFLAYANYLVDEMEIWIFNRWGNLVFHCFQTNETSGEPTCFWDGSYDGQVLPPGTFAVRINSRNIEKNLKKEEWKSILIVD